MESIVLQTHHSKETLGRSVAKTVSYRILILILDFTTIYLFTHKVEIAFSFMIVSNIYTTLGYFFHERLWDRIHWGKRIYKKAQHEKTKQNDS